MGVAETFIEKPTSVSLSIPAAETVSPDFKTPLPSIFGKPWQPDPLARPIVPLKINPTSLLGNYPVAPSQNKRPQTTSRPPQKDFRRTQYLSPMKQAPSPRKRRNKRSATAPFIPPLIPNLSRHFYAKPHNRPPMSKSNLKNPHFSPKSTNFVPRSQVNEIPSTSASRIPPLLSNLSRSSMFKSRNPVPQFNSIRLNPTLPLMSVKTDIFLPRSQVHGILGVSALLAKK